MELETFQKLCNNFKMENIFENGIDQNEKNSKNRQKKFYENFLNRKGLRCSLMIISLLTILQIFHILIQKE